MSRLALDVAVGSVAFAAVSILAFGYNLLRMGRYMKADTPIVGGFYIFPFGDGHFTDPAAKVFRDRCVRWFIAMLCSTVVFCALIMNRPNFEL